MLYRSKVTRDSEVMPGVRFTVRVLNQIQRARRDSEIVSARIRVSEIAAKLNRLPDPDREILDIRGKATLEDREPTGPERESIAAIEARHGVDEARIERARLDHEMACIINTELKPAHIRAALIGIEGLEIEGETLAAPWDALFAEGPADLIDEIYHASVTASGLTVDQSKNSSSPSPSDKQAGGGETISTATPADGAATT